MPSNQLSNTPTVVVTGASSGIGEASALRLDKLGFRVFAGIRQEADAEALQRKASKRLTPIFLDVAESASISIAAESVTSALGETGLNGLVNNAGIAIAGALEFLPIADLRRQLEVNVIGQIAVTQAFLPLLRQAQGRIVNVGSLGGRIVFPFNGPYHASKFALEALTDSLRVELRPWHIHMSLIEPGLIATPLWGKGITIADNFLKNLPPQAHQLYGPVIPAVRDLAVKANKIGTPVDAVAKAIVEALTSPKPKTRYIVGRGTLFGTVLFEHLPDKLRDLIIVQLLPKYP